MTTDPVAVALAFCCASSLTAIAYLSSFTWAEPLANLWIAAWLAIAAWGIAKGSTLSTALVSAFSATAPLIHGRTALVPVVWVAGVGGLAFLGARREPAAPHVRRVAVSVLVTGAVWIVADRIRAAVVEAAWISLDTAYYDRLRRLVTTPQYWRGLLLECLGQLWYITASTFGLAPVGLVLLVGLATGRLGRLDTAQRRCVAVGLLGLLSIVAVGAAASGQMLANNSPQRLDHVIYGRYAEPATAAFASIGLAYLGVVANAVRLRWFAFSGAVLSAVGLVVWIYARHFVNASDSAHLGSISGVSALPFDRPGLDIVRWSIVAGALIAVCAALSALHRRAFVSAAVVIVSTLGVIGARAGAQSLRSWDSAALYEPFDDAPDGEAVVPVAADAFTSIAYRYNFPLQQYVLAAEGWDLEVSELTSADLSRGLDDAVVTVLERSVVPADSGWCEVVTFNRVVVWARPGFGVAVQSRCT